MTEFNDRFYASLLIDINELRQVMGRLVESELETPQDTVRAATKLIRQRLRQPGKRPCDICSRTVGQVYFKLNISKMNGEEASTHHWCIVCSDCLLASHELMQVVYGDEEG